MGQIRHGTAVDTIKPWDQTPGSSGNDVDICLEPGSSPAKAEPAK